MEKNGQIVTDEHMRTSVPNIFAAGDITVGTQLSDKAQRQGLVIAETIAGGDYYINYDAIPATMFMEPEIAMVGLTVSDAAERGIETISGSLPFSSNEKAMAIGKTEGLIKVVARKDDHVIIGAQIFGHEACDLIAEMTVAVENGLTLEQVYNSIHPHPTVTEIILEVCKRAVGLSFDK
jgi:dihydrolipoamide dehydrogenase